MVSRKSSLSGKTFQAGFHRRNCKCAKATVVPQSFLINKQSSITSVKSLYTGKVVNVERDISRGYTVGRCIIAPLSADEQDDISSGGPTESRYLVIPFQNEYLSAGYVDTERGEGPEDTICTVPDLISILGQDGEALGSPELRYGLKVKVIGMPAHPLWTGSPEGLKIGGPEFFGLTTEWKSVGEYRRPKSVIEEFDPAIQT